MNSIHKNVLLSSLTGFTPGNSVWVPVKALMRFRCVSKWWNSLVFNPMFVKLHLQRSTICQKSPPIFQWRLGLVTMIGVTLTRWWQCFLMPNHRK
ncbi:hypothetical protein AAZX31_10G040000 [Glycine max]